MMKRRYSPSSSGETAAVTTTTTGQRRRLLATGFGFVLVLSLIAVEWLLQLSCLYGTTQTSTMLKENSAAALTSSNDDDGHDKKKKGRIAIISGFVTKDQSQDRPRMKEYFMNHVINKACYSTLWGYDYILNTTWGFDQAMRSRNDTVNEANHNQRYWLDYGTWHRVPHMIAGLDAGYEWVVYADIDWVVQDLAVPVQTLMKEWEHHGKTNVHIFVPSDDGVQTRVFSAFVVMVRNSEFGRAFLDNWMKFARGLCPNGNFPKRDEYSWEDSDQPGIWYSLAKTHSDFYAKTEAHKYSLICNTTTGLIQTNYSMAPELNNYTLLANLTKHADWNRIPDDQPIIWSLTIPGNRSGLGVQRTFGNYRFREDPYSYAIHKKMDLPQRVLKDIDVCRKRHGCHAGYDADGQLDVHCVRQVDNQTIRMVY